MIIYETITTIKIMNISTFPKCFLILLCNFSFLTPTPIAIKGLFSITVNYFTFSRSLCKWNI